MKLKRVMTALLAGIITAVSAAGSVSATTPPSSYDINGDGDVNVADIVALKYFLLGSYTMNDISHFDANQNGIVDELDVKSITAYVAMYEQLPTITMI